MPCRGRGGRGAAEGAIGRAKPFLDGVRLAEQVAPTESTVLILGDSGTGKGWLMCHAVAAELVEAQMRVFGWESRVDLVADGRPNVIATIEGDSPGRTLMFEGHTDVVTEGDLSTWTVDPFGADLALRVQRAEAILDWMDRWVKPTDV